MVLAGGAAGALLLGACRDEAATTAPAAGPAARAVKFWEAGATVGWNRMARDLVVEHATGAAPAIRVYALLSVAQYNAVVAAEAGGAGPERPSPAAAVAGASAAVLTYLYPGKAGLLEARVDDQAAAPAWPGEQGTDFAAGEAIGREVAAGMIERAKTDGYFAPFTGTVPVCDGCWVNGPAGPAFATLGHAKTFFLASGGQFRPAPPPAFGSPEFLAGLGEVRQISDTRTPAQDSIAKFWSLQGGTISPLGYWNLVASDLIVRHRLSERRAAHTLALMNAAGFDAVVASHEAKYTYWLIRPTQADPAITLPIALPSFPSYPSNHAAISAAAATVLGAVFPAARAALESGAVEAAISRIYGGIHYRFDADAGLELGRRVGRYVLDHGPVGREPLGLE
jgi:membrane-associated phospholipid phosphatase